MTGHESSHILLIEPNPVTCVMLASVLRKSGYGVTCAERPDEGLRLPNEGRDIALVVIGGGRSCDKQDNWARQLRLILPSSPRAPFVRLEQTLASETTGMPPRAEPEFSGRISRPLDPAAIVELVDSLLRPAATRAATKEPTADIRDRDGETAEQALANSSGSTGFNRRKEDLQEADTGDRADPQIAANEGGGKSTIDIASDCRIDDQAMQDLITLGGPDFAAEIVGQFVSDGARILKDITASIATQDGATFREQAHALRSCAANVGARGIYEMCLEWREADDHNLAEFGSEYARRLQENFEATSALLQDRYAIDAAAKPGQDTPRAARA